MDYDVFVSHASEDKEPFVAPMAKLLADLGVKVWYDAFTLKVGDSLSKSIDRGLSSSHYGIVVFSQAFFAKPWPDYELRGLIGREIGRDKVILPIWHNVTRDNVLAFSPTLADKIAIETSKTTIEEVVVQILEVVRPDLHRNLLRIGWWQKIVAQAKLDVIEMNKIHPGPIRHHILSKAFLLRIRLIHGVQSDAVSLSLDELIDGFKRDAHPEDEIRIWEAICVDFLEECKRRPMDGAQRKRYVEKLVWASMMPPEDDSNIITQPLLHRTRAAHARRVRSCHQQKINVWTLQKLLRSSPKQLARSQQRHLFYRSSTTGGSYSLSTLASLRCQPQSVTISVVL